VKPPNRGPLFPEKKPLRTLSYRIVGEPGEPAVLFVHGFMGSSRDWGGLPAAVCEGRYGIAVDLPGHGASVGLPAEAYTMAGASAGLARVLDAAGVRRSVVVGYSMGGRVALHFALHHPERCAGLVLESASPGLASEAERAARRAVDAARAERMLGDFGAFLDEWYRQPLFASLARREGLRERMTETRRRNDPAELARVLRGMGTGEMPSLWERLPGLRVATLAVAGALDAKYVALARRMTRAAPDVTVTVVPEAGHNVHAERPEAYLSHLRAFLQNLSV
jgi:2-succinyl-6-hydroxy-2,4-cyclohexadiene-1-carboxylate synthase